jgi:hypothetical protein
VRKLPRADARILYVVASLALVVLGLIWRLAPLGLPAFPLKYGGSILWAAMVYCLARVALPSSSIRRAAVVAGLVAVAVECVRLFHAPWLDDFRMTLPGALLLGRIFSLWNLVAYGIGIAAAAVADHFILRRRA